MVVIATRDYLQTTNGSMLLLCSIFGIATRGQEVCTGIAVFSFYANEVKQSSMCVCVCLCVCMPVWAPVCVCLCVCVCVCVAF